jgi:phage terminase large subunit
MQFISGELVKDAVQRRVEVIRGAPKVMAVDVARYGGDESVVAMRHGRRLEPLVAYRELDTMELTAEVAKLINAYHPDVVFVDEVGVGAGVLDRLKQLGYTVIGVNAGSSPEPANKGQYVNKRVEMWARMRDWLSGGEIPADIELMSQLVAPEYEYDARSRMVLESKEKMKKRGVDSPDRADALAMTFAFEVIPVKDAGVSWEPDPVPAY